jgi:hypothetical protein
MARKITTSITLAAFLVFTCSCVMRTMQKVPPEVVYGKDADILGVLTTSGEHIEFPKNAPGRIKGDKVVGNRIAREIKIAKTELQTIYRTDHGKLQSVVTKAGREYSADQIIWEENECVVVCDDIFVTSIPLKDIELVWIRKVNPGLTFLATLGGVGLTLGVVMGIIAAMKESCPFIYSFNGERYIFDAEPFGGAICEGLKRTESCALEEIKEVNGRYSILVTNEVDETQYTDELKLVVVDHTPETQVIPDELGRMHTVSNPFSPRRAVDGKGRDLIPVVGTNDWKFWLSRTADLRGDTIGPTKEELIFEFPKPEGTKAARLIFNGCATLWGSQMIKRLLDLRGNSVQEWYDDADSGGPSLMKTRMMTIREELFRLHIRVETTRGWTSKGLIQGGGPLISESRLYSFDISDVPGDTLRIKLTPAATFWMINSLGVDYSEDQPVLVNEVAPLEAHDALGRDVRDLLTLEDGEYLVMPRTGDMARVSFLSPPQKAGTVRSIFIKAGGYYDIHLEAKAAPQTEIIQRMLSEPGFVIRYAVKEYLKYLAEGGQKVRARSN